jgi:hypothetical protein
MTRRRPSTFSSISLARRSSTGLPWRSTTVKSTVTSSAPVRSCSCSHAPRQFARSGILPTHSTAMIARSRNRPTDSLILPIWSVAVQGHTQGGPGHLASPGSFGSKSPSCNGQVWICRRLTDHTNDRYDECENRGIMRPVYSPRLSESNQ